MSRKRKPKSTHRIQFKDECPGIGSGWRGIMVTNITGRFVHFRETATGAYGKLTIMEWNSIKKFGPNGEEIEDAPITAKAGNGSAGKSPRPKRKPRVRSGREAEALSESGSKTRKRVAQRGEKKVPADIS